MTFLFWTSKIFASVPPIASLTCRVSMRAACRRLEMIRDCKPWFLMFSTSRGVAIVRRGPATRSTVPLTRRGGKTELISFESPGPSDMLEY